MKLLTILKYFSSRSLFRQSILGALVFWVCLQLPLLLFTYKYIELEAIEKEKERRTLLSRVFEESFRSKARFGDLVNTRGEILDQGRALGLNDIVICDKKVDVLSKMSENKCAVHIEHGFKLHQENIELGIYFIWGQGQSSGKSIFLILVGFSFASLMFIFGTSLITYKFIGSRIKNVSKRISRLSAETSERIPNSNIPELNLLFASIRILQKKTSRYHEQVFNLKESALIGDLSSQVAHDIKSPLSALNMVISKLNIDDERQTLISSAISRINDIANGLLNIRRRKNLPVFESHMHTSDSRQASSLKNLVEQIVSEKKLQFAANLGIKFSYECDEDSEFLAYIDSIEFSRALSNVINNCRIS